MNRIKKIISAVMVVCLTVTVSGCDTLDRIKERIEAEISTTESDSIINTVQEVSNSLSVGILDFDTFNPLITKSETVKECMQFVYEPLFELNEKMQVEPVLAESYTVSADGRTIDIKLKNNVLWQDNTGFTAYDVAYTIKHIRAGITEYTDLLENMSDYKATDDYSLRIVLNYAVPNFMSTLTFPIVKYKSDISVNANYIPNGTGAFKYETQLSTGKLSFAAFDNYHKGKAKIDNLYVYTLPDLQKYESMFEASGIDIITGETVDLSEYTPRGSVRNNEYVTNKMTFLGYNLSNKLLWGTETRIGLSYLIDKENLVNSTIYSRGVACDIPINPSSIYYYDTKIKFKADEALAAQHLGNDNWGVNFEGKYTRRVNGEKQVLGFEILTNSDSNEKVNIANEIADRFNSFGVPAVVKALPYDEYMAKINAKDYDIMVGEIEVGANLDLTPLVSSADNYFSYKNTDLDTLVGQMGMTGDEEQMKILFKQYGETIVKDMPFAVLFYRKGNILSGAKIKSEVLPSISRLYRNVEAWSVKE